MSDDTYSKLIRRVWTDEKCCAWGPRDCRTFVLWLYMLTGPRCTSVPGLLAVGSLGLADDMGWPVPATRRALAQIEADKMVVIDPVARLMWLPNAIKHNMPANPSVVLGWSTPWRALPECALRTRAGQVMRAALAEEDARRGQDGRPTGLAAAFDVVTGVVSFADSGLRVGRPRQEKPQSSGRGQEHPVQHADPSGVKLQDQDQDQEAHYRRVPACDVQPATQASPTPRSIVDIAVPANSDGEDLLAKVARLATDGHPYAQQMSDRVAQGNTLSIGQRNKIHEIDAEAKAKIARGGTNGKPTTLSPDALAIQAAWLAARRAHDLPADCDPNPRQLLAFVGKVGEAIATAQRDRRAYVPTMLDAASDAFRQFFADDRVDPAYPLAWLMARFGETYPLVTAPPVNTAPTGPRRPNNDPPPPAPPPRVLPPPGARPTAPAPRPPIHCTPPSANVAPEDTSP